MTLRAAIAGLIADLDHSASLADAEVRTFRDMDRPQQARVASAQAAERRRLAHKLGLLLMEDDHAC